MDILKLELCQVSQEEDEHVNSYAKRIKDIEQRLEAAFDASQPNARVNDPDRIKIGQDVIEAFSNGLKNPREYQMAVKNPQTSSEASRIAQMLEKKLEFASGHRILTKTPAPPTREWKKNNVTFKDHRHYNHAIPNDDLMNLTDAIRDLKRDVRNMGRSANIRVATAGEGSPHKPIRNKKKSRLQPLRNANIAE